MRGPDIKMEEPYRVTRDKINVLARAVSEALATLDNVDFIEDKNTIRQEVRKILEQLFLQEKKIDAAARHKIESQRRNQSATRGGLQEDPSSGRHQPNLHGELD